MHLGIVHRPGLPRTEDAGISETPTITQKAQPAPAHQTPTGPTCFTITMTPPQRQPTR